AVEKYAAYYRSIEGSLPVEFRRLQDNYFLHDAQVLYLGQQGSRFVIALRLDPPPQQVLQLNYELTREPRINREILPAAHRQGGSACWLYDEVELLSASPPSGVHSILLSNGWEVQLPFQVLQI